MKKIGLGILSGIIFIIAAILLSCVILLSIFIAPIIIIIEGAVEIIRGIYDCLFNKEE